MGDEYKNFAYNNILGILFDDTIVTDPKLQIPSVSNFIANTTKNISNIKSMQNIIDLLIKHITWYNLCINYITQILKLNNIQMSIVRNVLDNETTYYNYAVKYIEVYNSLITGRTPKILAKAQAQEV